MKTRIEIDNTLVADALQATGLEATDQVVELALKMLIQMKHQEAIKNWRGKLRWDGNLDTIRTDS